MNINEFLKNETASLHLQVENYFESKQIFDKSFSKSQYIKLLIGNYKLIAAIEELAYDLLDENLIKELEKSQRLKKRVLEKEIELLDVSVQDIEVPRIILKNKFEALGALYTIEGSTLGGNVIVKQLAKNENFANHQFLYFGMYKDLIAERWKSFLQILQKECSSDEVFSEVLAGTTKAYQVMLN